MRRLLTSGIFVVFCFLTVAILAQVPQLLNYQGRLTDDAGIPIITTTTLRFSLYQGGDAATPGSGTLCYREDASVTPDDNGVFSHLIGSGTVLYGTLDATVFQTASPVFLEIAVDPAGANETLLPRKQIVTVGYSFKAELADDADTVDGQDASAFAPVVHNHDPDYVNEGQADSVTSAMIVDGTIVDADINAGANIAGSKIDPTGLDADLLDGVHATGFVSTTGDDMTGTLNVNTATQYALYGATSHTSGYGVSGFASTTSGLTYGVYGESVSSSGHGVYGYASATSGINYGIYGISSSNSGYGVYGRASNLSGTNYGVYGQSASTAGRGVYGYASAASGINYGVYGETASTSNLASGVYGYASGTSGKVFGVYARSDSPSGYGVFAEATAASGVNFGLLAVSNSPNGAGVKGSNVATSGSAYGVHGRSDSSGGYGIYGEATASSGTNYGVYGTTNSASGYAGYFQGNAHVTGELTVGGGLDADLLDGKDSLEFVHTAGDDMTGTLTINTSSLQSLYGTTSNTSGIGVYGEATASSGTNYGVYGTTNSASGYAGYFQGNAHVTGELTVGGGLDADLLDGKDSLEFVHTAGDDMTGTLTINTSSLQSLYGTTSNTSGIGVYGEATATSGTNYGVYATTDSASGYGVYGQAPTYGVYGLATGTSTEVITYGVYGKCNSPAGYAVYGEATATSGMTYGVWGKSNCTNGQGVFGTAPKYGVFGIATATSGNTYGVYGSSESTEGRGVHGSAPKYGVFGEGTASGVTYGVYGRSESIGGYGVYGTSPFYGVMGSSESGRGVFGLALATSGTNYGVYGRTNSASGYAGYFSGNAHVTGNFTVGGSKTCVQPIDNGKKVLLYAMESPEIWFEDFGSAQLVNGQAVVQLESVFTQAANTEIAYFVFPIPNGDCNGLYIARQDKDSFEVRELGGGTSSISFHYRIVAKRRGYEEVRFEEFTEPEQTPAEPNLPIEKK